MITKWFCPKSNNITLEDPWLQYDGATPYFANETIQILKEKDNGGVILRNGDSHSSVLLFSFILRDTSDI